MIGLATTMEVENVRGQKSIEFLKIDTRLLTELNNIKNRRNYVYENHCIVISNNKNRNSDTEIGCNNAYATKYITSVHPF